MNNVISVQNLEKSYGSNKVLKNISFQVRHGEIFALLGINGAGKTTTLECLEGLRKYNSGSIVINGTRGIQLQSSSLPQNMKAAEALRFFAKWNHSHISDEYLSKIDVTPFLNKQYSQLSTGQKRRLHLALAMLGSPDIIFLDEPTAGLDVEGRSRLHQEIRRLKTQGKTIIIASHDMAEVEALCDRIAILKNGKIVFTGTTAELTQNMRGTYQLAVRFSKPPCIQLSSACNMNRTEQNCFMFNTEDLTDTLIEITDAVKAQNILILDIKVNQASLEQKFLSLVKED